MNIHLKNILIAAAAVITTLAFTSLPLSSSAQTVQPIRIAEGGAEGDDLPLSYDNPVALLSEHFNGVAHNKPLAVDGWKNLASIGMRAWWGYTFPDYDTDNAGQTVAKVTAYDSKMEAGLDEECQMVLVTPPLDYKNAASHMFTFRMMGKFMVENMSEEILLCILSEEEGQLMAYPIEEIVLPRIPDENGDWHEYQVDLDGRDIPDVFHLGFVFTGMRGPDHATTYFLDDVTYGRTDIPVIRTSTQEVYMEAVDGAEVTSPEVTVTTENLITKVDISLEGKYKDDFILSNATLPKEGGKFTVTYVGTYTDGYYGVYAKLSSEGTAPKYVAFFATIVTGIQSVEVSPADVVEITSLGGTLVSRTTGMSLVDALGTLHRGTYIVSITGTSGTRTLKISR